MASKAGDSVDRACNLSLAGQIPGQQCTQASALSRDRRQIQQSPTNFDTFYHPLNTMPAKRILIQLLVSIKTAAVISDRQLDIRFLAEQGNFNIFSGPMLEGIVHSFLQYTVDDYFQRIRDRLFLNFDFLTDAGILIDLGYFSAKPCNCRQKSQFIQSGGAQISGNAFGLFNRIEQIADHFF